ncbi:hypothetical protein [Fusobacterium polymorphum]|uniref:hypothetical protein n=1 Tax=Fusobacterium nucleatum subsp. polymorphum TaxID=76857 RepID=UPI003009FE7A
MEKAKILRNLEKLALRDFEFINDGRIAVVADSKKISTDLVKSICLELNINPLQIQKNDLVKIIDHFKTLDI